MNNDYKSEQLLIGALARKEAEVKTCEKNLKKAEEDLKGKAKFQNGETTIDFTPELEERVKSFQKELEEARSLKAVLERGLARLYVAKRKEQEEEQGGERGGSGSGSGSGKRRLIG